MAPNDKRYCKNYDPTNGNSTSMCTREAVKMFALGLAIIHLCVGCLGSVPEGAVPVEVGKQKKQTKIQIMMMMTMMMMTTLATTTKHP